MYARSRLLGGILACLLAAAAGPVVGQVRWRCSGSAGIREALTCPQAIRQCVEECGDVRNCEFLDPCDSVDPGEETFLIQLDWEKLADIFRLIATDQLRVVLPRPQPDPSPEDFGISVLLPALENKLTHTLGEPYFEVGDFQLFAEPEGFNPLILEEFVEEHVVREGANGDELEAINLFFPVGSQSLPMLQGGELSFSIANNTTKTAREAPFSISAVGRGRLLVPTGPARWTATCLDGSTATGTSPNALQAWLDCRAACREHGGVATCDIDGGAPAEIPSIDVGEFLPDLVRGHLIDIPDIREILPRAVNPQPQPGPGPDWGISVFVPFEPIGVQHDAGKRYFLPGDLELLVTPENFNPVFLREYIEEGIESDLSGVIGDAEDEGVVLYFHVEDPQLIALFESGPIEIGLVNQTDGTPRERSYPIGGLGRGRVYPTRWFWPGPAEWTATCADGSVHRGVAANAFQAHLECYRACVTRGGVVRCDVEGGEAIPLPVPFPEPPFPLPMPVPLPWLEGPYVLPDLVRGPFEEIPAIDRLLGPIFDNLPVDRPQLAPDRGVSVFIPSDPAEKPVDWGVRRFELGDIGVLFSGDPSPGTRALDPLRPVTVPDLVGGLLEEFVVDPVDNDRSGFIGDAVGEGHVLFFPVDNPAVESLISSGTLSLGLINNTAGTARSGHLAIGAIGRGRLLFGGFGGPARWTCASGGSGEASSCVQAALDCAAACPGGLSNCDVDCPEPTVIPWIPDVSFLPDLVSIGPGVLIPDSWDRLTPDPQDPDPRPWPPWPPIPGPRPLPEIIPAWGLSVVVDLNEILIGLNQPFFKPGDWAMVIEFGNGEIVELTDFLEDPLDLDGSGVVGDGDREGVSLFFHTSDPDIAERLGAGDFQVGLRNLTAGTSRQGDFAITDFGRGRVFPGGWIFRTTRWTAYCNAPGSEPTSGIAPNVLQAQIDCEVACRSEGGVLRCEIDGGPLPLPWFEREHILPDILRVNPFELPDIADILPLPRNPDDEPGPDGIPAWGISVFLPFDVLERPPVAANRDFFDADDFVLVFSDDPSPQPSAPLPPDLADFLFLDTPIQELIDLDENGLVGDAPGEGINLFFTTDDESLRQQIDSGTMSIGLLNRTPDTPRAGLYAIGAIGRARLLPAIGRMDLVAVPPSACGATGSVYVEVTSPEPIEGFSLGLEWDPTRIELVGAVGGPDVEPDHVSSLIVNGRERHLGRATVGLILDALDGPIDATRGVRAVEVKFRAAPGSTGEATPICIRAGFGDPPVGVVVTVQRGGSSSVSTFPIFGCTTLALAPDTTPPTIVCPDDIEVTGTANGATVGWQVDVFDECNPVDVTCTPPPGSVFAVGTTTVICEAKDPSGNISECSFDVIVTEVAGFRRADANVDGAFDVSDPIQVLTHLFLGADMRCADASDYNDDQTVDVTDPIGMLAHIFLGADPPAAPGPSECGQDPTPDNLPECDYEACF